MARVVKVFKKKKKKKHYLTATQMLKPKMAQYIQNLYRIIFVIIVHTGSLNRNCLDTELGMSCCQLFTQMFPCQVKVHTEQKMYFASCIYKCSIWGPFCQTVCAAGQSVFQTICPVGPRDLGSSAEWYCTAVV